MLRNSHYKYNFMIQNKSKLIVYYFSIIIKYYYLILYTIDRLIVIHKKLLKST